PYFINQEAVWGLLSRVYLYMEKWDKSVQYADLVLDARPQLPTNNNYLNQYFQLSGYEAETLFRLNGMDKGSSLYSYFNYRQLTGSQVPAVQISQNLLSEYTSSNQSDLRSSGLIAVFGNVNSPSYVTKKFDVIHPDGTENNKFHVNPIVIRVAEVYLNRAEAYVALNQPEKAAADVKKILARALMVSENTIDLPSNNVNAMRELVYKERMKELAFEGHRLFDITRRKQDL